MSTDVYYGDVTLKNVVTRQWEQDVTYDESNTDRICSAFNLAWDCTIHATELGEVLPPTYVTHANRSNNDSSQTIYQVVRKMLEQPRQLLEVRVNSETVLRAAPYDGIEVPGEESLDVANGPTPQNVSIQHIGGEVFRIRFAIRATIAETAPADGGSARTLPVLSNRWSIQERIDDKFFVTRIISGRLRLSSAKVPAHAYKYLVVPGRELGFARQEINFTVDASGLNCDYTVIDRQVHTAAPWPAVKMSARQTETTNDGVTFFSELMVRLEGSPESSKSLMFQRILQIADARINFSEDASFGGDNYVEQFSLTEHIGEENVVEGLFRLRQFTDEASSQGNLRVVTLGQPFELEALAGSNTDDEIAGSEYDPQVTRFPSLYGYNPQGGVREPAVALLLTCFQQTTADNNHAIPTSAEFDVEDGEDKSKEQLTEGSITTVDSLPETSRAGYASTHAENIYLFARMESKYSDRKAKIQLPIAAPVGVVANVDTSAVVTLARGIAKRIITVDAERVGAAPELPDPVDSYEDGTVAAELMTHNITALPPTKSPDGQKLIYRAMAYYVYALSRPYVKGDNIPTGRLPYVAWSPGEQVLVTDDVYTPDLIL